MNRLSFIACAALLVGMVLTIPSNADAQNVSGEFAPASVIGSSAGSSGEITSMPVGVPAGPQTSVIACPSNPSWDPPLPIGATVSVSLLGLSGVVAEVAGQRVATVSDCSYSVVYPATPGL